MNHFRRLISIVWIVLIIATASSFFFFPAFQFTSFSTPSINPFTMMVFTLMGVWPLLFLYIGWLYQASFTKRQWWGLLGGFALGSFIVMPIYRQANLKSKRFFTYNHSIWLFALLLIPIIILAGFVQGDFGNYLSMMYVDPLITIMTFDFLAFYALSILVAFKTAYRPWWSLLPLVGFIIAHYPTKSQIDQ